VEEAARRAAQSVAQIHRRRLVVQSFLGALVAACIISIPTIIIVSNNISNSERGFAKSNALYDCNLFIGAAKVMGDFVSSDANLRKTQGRQGFSRKLAMDIEKIIPAADLAQLAATQQTQITTAVTLWNKDARKLASISGTDCVKHLGGG
jgi:hypothetical protein